MSDTSSELQDHEIQAKPDNAKPDHTIDHNHDRNPYLSRLKTVSHTQKPQAPHSTT